MRRSVFASATFVLLFLGFLLPLLEGCGGGSSPRSTQPAQNPAPQVASLAPAAVLAGSTSQTVTITGSGFIASSVAQLGNISLQTTYVSSTSLQAVLPANAIAAGQTASITVTNPAPGGGTSPAAAFNINSPTPSIGGLTPSSVPANAAVVITVNGTGFEANSTVLWNGSPRPTTFVSGTSLQVMLTAADTQSYGSDAVTVNNPGPGGSTTAAVPLVVAAPPPVISSLSPSGLPINSPAATLTIAGQNFASNATVQASGHTLSITSQSATQILATLPASLLASSGTLAIVVTNPPAAAGLAAISTQPANFAVTAPTANFSVSPNFAASGSGDTTINLYGQGFFPDSVVQWNGLPLATVYISAGQLTATVPASYLLHLGVSNIGIATPENGAQSPPLQPFSTYLPLTVNDLAWNAKDGLIYATTPGSDGPALGNSLVALDPNTGTVQRRIFVGSDPNRLAISDDGTTAFVGLDSAGAVRQVDLQAGVAGAQFGLGGGPGVYNPPYTAAALAVLPGQPHSVAVYSVSGVVSIYDNGVARAKNSAGLQTYFTQNYGGLAFGDSASTLYVSSEAIGSYVYRLTVDATGVTASTQLSVSGGGRTLQYDKGRLYFPVGTVIDATTGSTLGQFSAPSGTSGGASAATGPVVSDSTLNRAWVVSSGGGPSNGQLLSFDETTFNPVSTLPLTGVGQVGVNSYIGNSTDLIRWGQSGLAFHTGGQVYILNGLIVKDTSSTPADLGVAAAAPASATTGVSFAYQFKVSNAGPNTGRGVTLVTTLPASLYLGTVTASQGSCVGSGYLYCDLGDLSSGATATVTVNVTPTQAVTAQVTAVIASQSYDGNSANNQVTTSTAVTGALFSAPPTISQVVPNLLGADGSTQTLTVNGSGFTSASAVLWNGVPLPTSLINSGQLTATVDGALLNNFGSAQVAVTSAPPGGGQSEALTVSLYKLLNVPANVIRYDPFTRKIYAALPSTSTAPVGNSIVAIDGNTGSVSTPVPVGSEPNLLSETSDGNYLFIGLSGAKSLGRFNLLTQALDQTIPLVNSKGFPQGPAAALSIATIPGSDTALAVEFDSFDGIGILDINGNTGTLRKNFGFGYSGDFPVFTDPTHFYAYDAATTGAEFYRYVVDQDGAKQIDGTTLLGMGGFGGRLAVDGGLVYGSAGGIINPSTTPPSQVAVLPIGNGPYGNGLIGGGVIPYAAQQKSFNIGVNAAGTALDFVERFDTQHFVLEDSLQLPGEGSVSSINGTRWGQDGLAYVILGGPGSNAPPQVLLLRGAFVLPAEASTHAAPTLTSAGSGSIQSGSGNQYLNVTGTGFLPGASVLWNGVAFDTTFVDAQHLTVAVGAGDIKTAGSVTLTCQNPGSPASNGITIAVQ